MSGASAAGPSFATFTKTTMVASGITLHVIGLDFCSQKEAAAEPAIILPSNDSAFQTHREGWAVDSRLRRNHARARGLIVSTCANPYAHLARPPRFIQR